MEYDNPELKCAKGTIDESLTYGRIKSARDSLAKALNRIEALNTEIKAACSLEHWNDDVALQIDEAATMLGYALATLTTWDSDVEAENQD